MRSSVRTCGALGRRRSVASLMREGARLLKHSERIVEHVGNIACVAVEVKDCRVLPRVLALDEPAVHQFSWEFGISAQIFQSNNLAQK